MAAGNNKHRRGDCFFFLSKMRVAESGFQREAGEGGTKRGEEFSCLLYGIDPFGRLPTYQNGAGIKLSASSFVNVRPSVCIARLEQRDIFCYICKYMRESSSATYTFFMLPQNKRNSLGMVWYIDGRYYEMRDRRSEKIYGTLSLSRERERYCTLPLHHVGKV